MAENARIQGRCPACGAHSLLVSEGGHLVCSSLDCPNPGLVDTMLSSGPKQEARDLQEELRAWWNRVAANDFEQMRPKLGEYTSADLAIMGDVMEAWGVSAPELGSEAACIWYILGKVARAVAAYREGRAPSEDTLHDIRVYATMAQRIRERGSWP